MDKGAPARSLPEPGPAIEDSELVASMAAGDMAALGALYDRFVPRMLAVAIRMLGSTRDAEDLVQDVFLEAWHRAPHFDPQRGTVRAWLMTRLRSRALDRLRSSQRRRAAAETIRSQSSDPLYTDGSESPDRIVVRQWVEALPSDQRRALELSYFAGLTAREVAEELSLPIGTVKSRVSRAISGLRGRVVATEDVESESNGGAV